MSNSLLHGVQQLLTPPVTQVGDVLIQKMLLFDGHASQFRTVKLRPRCPACKACGDSPFITAQSLAGYDYTAFTGQAADDKGDFCFSWLNTAGYERKVVSSPERMLSGFAVLCVRLAAGLLNSRKSDQSWCLTAFYHVT